MSKKPTPPPDTFVPPDWSGDARTHLESLRVYAEARIDAELSWYFQRKDGLAWRSRNLRFFALILTVVGGLVPVLVAFFGSKPAWLGSFAGVQFGQLGYLLLAIAGGIVLIDSFFGYSTGWMRYILAIQAIEKSREQFRLDWTALLRVLSTTKQDSAEYVDVLERMIQRARSVIVEVKEQSEKETQAWIAEFQSNLAKFEKDLKSQVEANRPGAIDVEVTDGRKADSSVELLLDGMTADRFNGTAGTIGFVAPGIHRVTAKAQKANRDFAASALVSVGGGQVCQVKLTLGLP